MEQEELSSTQKAGKNLKTAGTLIGCYIVAGFLVGFSYLILLYAELYKIASIVTLVYGLLGFILIGIAAIQLYDAGSRLKGELK